MTPTERGRIDGLRYRARLDRRGVRLSQSKALYVALDAGERHWEHVTAGRLAAEDAAEYGLAFLSVALAPPCATCGARVATHRENCSACEGKACPACGRPKHEPDQECREPQ